jgi:aldehyde:ferredoxin oxidoreductase
MHDPRGKTGLGLAYALSPTGADHVEHPHDPTFQDWNENLKEAGMIGVHEPVKPLSMGPDKVRHYFYFQHVWGLYNIIGMCNFVGFPVGRFSLDHITEYVKAVTGWNTSIWELFKATERSFHLFRVFNCREGFSLKDDTLPDRFFEPLPAGALKGHSINREEFDEAIQTYYGMMGWDAEGRPTKPKLHEINLSWLIPMIYGEKKEAA